MISTSVCFSNSPSHPYIHTYIHIYKHIYIYIYIYRAYIYIYTYIGLIYIYTYIHTYIHTHTHTYIYIYIYIHIHIHIHIHIGLYLKLTLAEKYSKIIELSPIDWVILWVAMGLVFVVYYINKDVTIYIFFGVEVVALALALVGYYFFCSLFPPFFSVPFFKKSTNKDLLAYLPTHVYLLIQESNHLRPTISS